MPPKPTRGRKKKTVQEEQFKVGPEIDPATLNERQRYNMLVTRHGAYTQRGPPEGEGEWQLPNVPTVRTSGAERMTTPLSSPVDTDEAQKIELVKERLKEIMVRPYSSETDVDRPHSARSTPTGRQQYKIERERFPRDTLGTGAQYMSVEDLNSSRVPKKESYYDRPDFFLRKTDEKQQVKDTSIETGYMSFQDPNDKTIMYHHPAGIGRENITSPSVIQDPIEIESRQHRLDKGLKREGEIRLTPTTSVCSLDGERQQRLSRLETQSPGEVEVIINRRHSLPLGIGESADNTQIHQRTLTPPKPMTPQQARDDLRRVIQQTHASTLYGDPGQNPPKENNSANIIEGDRQEVNVLGTQEQKLQIVGKEEEVPELGDSATSADYIEYLMHERNVSTAESWLPNTEIKDGDDPWEITLRKDEDGYPSFFIPGTENKRIVEMNARRCHGGLSPKGNPLGCIGIPPLHEKYGTTYYEYDRVTGELFIIRDRSRFKIQEKLSIRPYSSQEYEYAFIRGDLEVVPDNLNKPAPVERVPTYDNEGREEEIRPSTEPSERSIRDDEDGYPNFFIPFSNNLRVTEANPRRIQITSPKGNPMALFYVSSLRTKYGTDEIAYDRATGDMYIWHDEILTSLPDKLNIFAYLKGSSEYKQSQNIPQSSPMITSSQLETAKESILSPRLTPIKNGSAFKPLQTPKPTPDINDNQRLTTSLIHTPPYSPVLEPSPEGTGQSTVKVQKTEHVTAVTETPSRNTGARPKQILKEKQPWATPKYLEGYEFMKQTDRPTDVPGMRIKDESKVMTEIARLRISATSPCEIDEIPVQLPDDNMEMSEKASFITRNSTVVQMKRVAFYAHFKLAALKTTNAQEFHQLKIWYGKKLCKLLNKDYNLQLLESKINREWKEEQERKRKIEKGDMGEGPKTIVPKLPKQETPIKPIPRIVTLPDVITTGTDSSFQFQGDSTGVLSERDLSITSTSWTDSTVQQVLDRGVLTGKQGKVGHVLPQPQQKENRTSNLSGNRQNIGQQGQQRRQSNIPIQPRTNPNFRIHSILEPSNPSSTAPEEGTSLNKDTRPVVDPPIIFVPPGPPPGSPPSENRQTSGDQLTETSSDRNTSHQNVTSQTETQTTVIHAWESPITQNLDTNNWNQRDRSLERTDRGRGRANSNGNNRNQQSRGSKRGRGNGRGASKSNNRPPTDRNFPVGHWEGAVGGLSPRSTRTNEWATTQIPTVSHGDMNRDWNNNQRPVDTGTLGLERVTREQVVNLPIPGTSRMVEGQTSPLELMEAQAIKNMPISHRSKETIVTSNQAKWIEKQRRIQILRQAPILLPPYLEQKWMETEDIDLFNATFPSINVESGINLNSRHTVHTIDPSQSMAMAAIASVNNYQPRFRPNQQDAPLYNPIHPQQMNTQTNQQTVVTQPHQQRPMVPPNMGPQGLQNVTYLIDERNRVGGDRTLPGPDQRTRNVGHISNIDDPDQTYPMQIHPTQQQSQPMDPPLGPDDTSPFAGGHMSRGGRPKPDHDFGEEDFVIDPITGHAYKPSSNDSRRYSPDRGRTDYSKRPSEMGKHSQQIGGMRDDTIIGQGGQPPSRSGGLDTIRPMTSHIPRQVQVDNHPYYPPGTSRGQPPGSSGRPPSRPPSRQPGPPPLGNPYGSGIRPPGAPSGEPPGGPPGRPPSKRPPKPPPIDGPYENVHPGAPPITQVEVKNLYGPLRALSGAIEKWADKNERFNFSLSRYLQHSNKNQENLSEYLRNLTYNSEQRGYDHLFNTLETYDGSNKKQCLKWIERLEVLCDKTNRDIKLEALALSKGPVQDCLMSMPPDLPWSECRKELQRCFSDVITDAHAAMKLHFMKQGEENLRNYCNEYIRVHFLATKQYASACTDKTRIIHFMRGIRNVSIVKKITMSPNGLPKTLLGCAQLAIALESTYQLSEGISRAYDPDFLTNIESPYPIGIQAIEEVEEPEEVEALIRRPYGRSNKCWICGESGHYHYECPIYLAAEQGDDKAMNTVVGQMTYNLTAQQPVTAKVLKYLIDKLRTVNMMKDKYKKAADKKPADPPTTKPQKKVIIKDTKAQPVRTTAVPVTTTVQRTTGTPAKFTRTVNNKKTTPKTAVKTATTSTILRRSPRTSTGKNTIASSSNANLAKNTVSVLDEIVEEEEDNLMLEEDSESIDLRSETEEIDLIQLNDELDIDDHSQ